MIRWLREELDYWLSWWDDPTARGWLCRFGKHSYVRRSFLSTPPGKREQCARWNCMRWR